MRWTVKFSKPDSTASTEKLNYWKGDYQAFNQELEQIDWSTALKGKEKEEILETFHNKLYQLFAKYVRVKKSAVKKIDWLIDWLLYGTAAQIGY